MIANSNLANQSQRIVLCSNSSYCCNCCIKNGSRSAHKRNLSNNTLIQQSNNNMKLLLISGFVVSGVYASGSYYEPYTYTSLRGSAFTDSLSTSTARNLQNDPFSRIHCSWNSRYTRHNILQQCARRDDGHYWPYECDDGRSMCCTESYINEPNLRNFGRCTRVPGGPL